jgi:hypothetical protein
VFSHDAVIRVYNEGGNVIETLEYTGDFKEPKGGCAAGLPGLTGRSSRLLETSGALRLQVLQPNRETKNVTGKIPVRSLAAEAQEALKQNNKLKQL